MQLANIEKTFCTTREAATLLGVSVGTVQLWVEAGLLKAWKTAGGHRRVLRDSVDGLLHKSPDTLVAPSEPGSSPNSPRRLSVLVVEDDPNLLRLYQANMSRWPMKPQVVACDNAFVALMKMGHSGPDLLITDLFMPDIDGFIMLKILYKAPEMVNTTMVVVTGLDAEAVQDRGGVPPGVEVLPKPIPFERLLAIATGIVNQSCSLISSC